MSADRFATIRRPIYGKSQKVAYTGTAGTTTALPQSTAAVLVYLSTAGYVKVGYGTSLAATANDVALPANTPLVIPVEPPHPNDSAANVSAGLCVSAVQDAAGGNLFVTPLAD